MGSTSEGSLLQETRLLSDKILETAHVLKTVMMRVSTLEKKMESLREENLSEKLKNKHLNAELARERKQSQEQQRRQSQLPNHHQNTNPDDDGEVDDVKTLVMMRRAAGNARPERRRRRRRHRMQSLVFTTSTKRIRLLTCKHLRRLFLPRQRRQTR